MTFLRVVLVALLLVALATAVSAESTADYHRMLDELSNQLDRARQMEQAKPDSSVPLLKKLWNDCPASVVVASGGESVDADMGWVRDELYELQRAKSSDRIDGITALQERLSLLASSSGVKPGMGEASVDKAKSTLRQVLASHEYKPSLIERIKRWILELVAELLSRLSIGGGATAVIAWVMIVVAVIIFIVVVVYLVMHLVKTYSGNADREHSIHRAKLKSSRRLTPESVLEAAERDAAAGRYREAFRGVYLASILLLDRAKLLKYTEGVTNWEYLRTLKQGETQESVPVFSDMTMLFDEYIYGNRAVSGGDYDRTLKHYRKLEGLF